MTPDITRIRAAYARLQGHVRQTPLLGSAQLDRIAGRRILVKAECLQHTGSFKARGAWSALSALDEQTRCKGVLAYSSGNHAQGVARAAHAFGCKAVIVMPRDTPRPKIAGTRAFGAEIVFYDRATENREAIGTRLAAEGGLTLIKPYDDPEVIAGQASVGLEIAKQAGAEGITRAEVIACCGGGGLSAGIALALEAEAPDFKLRTAEPEGFDDVARSLRSGEICRNAALSGSICDAIVTPQPGDLTFPILKRLAGSGLVVSDDEALQAMSIAFETLKLVIEPGGAVALASALFRRDELSADTAIVVVSGGNVSADIFARAITTDWQMS